MAIGRLCMKVGKAGKAGPHAAYIAREGKYAARLDQNEKLEATESGNMPVWARHCPQEFWNAADLNERKNGTTYREMEIALPRELSPQQRVGLVRDFVRMEVGERHAYQWAIHTPKAADGGEQPHVHLMFSERQRDRIERDPEQYFKRYNAKNPANGGARKGYGPSAGITLSATERKTELRALRDRWEQACNAHLQRAGAAERIDMRSHTERSTGLLPERKYLPSEWRDPKLRGKVIDFRQARAELSQTRETLRREVPSAGAEIINLEAERERRNTDRNKLGHSPIQAAIAADQEGSSSDMVNKTNNPATAGREVAERASFEQVGRIAAELSQKNERRENRESLRLQGKGPDVAKEAQGMLEKRERIEHEKSAQEQTRRIEQAKRDEQERLINQLQREKIAAPSSALAKMKQQAVEKGHMKNCETSDQMPSQKVASLQRVRARMADMRPTKEQDPLSNREQISPASAMERMRAESEQRRDTKGLERDDPDMEF